MKRNTGRRKQNRQKAKLALPDLEHTKAAVLDSLRSPESQRATADPSMTLLLVLFRASTVFQQDCRHPLSNSSRRSTIGSRHHKRTAGGRASTGLRGSGYWTLEPELAAGIRRVKGSKKLGIRLGNWLTVDEARTLWQLPSSNTLKGARDRAILHLSLSWATRKHLNAFRAKHAVTFVTIQGDHGYRMRVSMWQDTRRIATRPIHSPACRRKIK